MGMTMTQKILAAHAGLDHVEAGQLIEANLDLVLGNDITSPVAIHEMEKLDKQTVFDRIRLHWLWIILSQIKILSQLKIVSAAVILHADMRSVIILM